MRGGIGWMIVGAGLLAGCALGTDQAQAPVGSPAAGAVAAAAGAADTRLYVMDCGRLSLDDISSFGLDNSDTPVRELFVPCYLVVHPEGTLLWDTGLPLSAAGAGSVELEPGARMRYQRSLPEQLDMLGHPASELDLLAMSHMHFDHAGGANAFAEATLLIQAAEHDAAFLRPEDHPVFEPALYQALQDSDVVRLDGDHDVFGDGRVVILASPGHTPGHQALFVDLANYGPVVLSGDLWHFRASRRLRAVPTFNTDAAQTRASMDRIEALIEHSGATLWIQHDLALAQSLRLAPAWYD